MDIKSKITEVRKSIVDFGQKNGIQCSPQSLQDPINYMLDMPSKKIRPLLCYMSQEMFAEPNEELYYACWSIENFHDFTLMHDDIMDNAEMRRGEESAYKKYGLPQTILSGDAMLILSYKYLQNLNTDIIPIVLKRFSQTALEVCQGQQEDMDFEKLEEVSYDQYLQMISQKTAVLLAYSCWLGATNATASSDDQDKLWNFGYNLGMAFQLLDDYLDAFGDQNKVGKIKGGDVLMNKKTALFIKSVEALNNPSDRDDFRKAYRNANQENVETVLDKMQNLGAGEQVQKDIESYTNNALEILDSIDVDDSYKEDMRALCNFLLYRNS